MAYLIDTNVLSEMRKRGRGNARVHAWALRTRVSAIFLSVLVVGEVRRGIELLRSTDPAQTASLEEWLAKVCNVYGGRILPITQPIAEEWARLSTPDRIPVVDGLLAATAKVHKLVLVTRNTRDVVRTGVQILNPFDEPSPSP
ncbi:MAG: type II toxin-antitoxin system VapC family toxin [Minicystis sp.]